MPIQNTILESENDALRQQLECYGRDLGKSLAELSQRLRQLDRAHNAALVRLARAAAFKDDDTGTHVVRIGRSAAHLARALGCDDAYATLLEKAAPMHDVGKIGIPDAILQKPGALTPEEWVVMRKHTEFGAQILGGTDIPVFELAAEVALSHHENYDGSGYPHGRAGNDIPLSGRIVALVDYFDALTMDRCYRKAFDDDTAFEMIRAVTGRKFDSIVVEAFLDVSGDIIRLRDEIKMAA